MNGDVWDLERPWKVPASSSFSTLSTQRVRSIHITSHHNQTHPLSQENACSGIHPPTSSERPPNDTTVAISASGLLQMRVSSTKWPWRTGNTFLYPLISSRSDDATGLCLRQITLPSRKSQRVLSRRNKSLSGSLSPRRLCSRCLL